MRYTFKKYSGERIDYEQMDIYSSLAEELNVSRPAAKRAFWTLVLNGSDLRIGAALDNLRLDEISAENDHTYAVSGAIARPIISHYVSERYRILHLTGAINYHMPIDNSETV